MGFFDKLTGGGAKVTLTVEGTTVKDVIRINANVVLKDSDMQISKVYLYVKSVEHVNVPRREMPSTQNQQPMDLDLNVEIFKQQEYVIAQAQTLKGGATLNFPYELTLPQNVTPTYMGRYTSHEWYFYVGLDAKGNDPDSGWVKVVLN